MANKILVVDFGSQYNQLITRRIREIGVYSKLVHANEIFNEIDKDVKGIIFSGGPNSVYDKKSLTINKKIYGLKIPILGICYGMQLIAHQLGGKVEKSSKKEYGNALVYVKQGFITKDLSSEEKV
jgi:GMP synthase (glutamine-hydrolysing)